MAVFSTEFPKWHQKNTQTSTFAFIVLDKTKRSLYILLNRYAFNTDYGNLMSLANGKSVTS